jgi:hypothetical protein
MAKNDDTEPCPPPPGGCGGKGWVEENLNGKTRKVDCFTCYGSGRIPKR